jgi:hypothetical protein
MSQKLYLFDVSNYALYKIVDIDDGTAPDLSISTLSAPSKAMIKKWESKEVRLIFDKKTEKWSGIKLDNSAVPESKIEDSKDWVDHFIRVNLRSSFKFADVEFSMEDSKCIEYNELAIFALMKEIKYPVSIKAIGNAYVTLNSLEELKNFLRTMRERKELIRSVGRAIKYGGTVNGVEIKSISDSELYKMDPDAIGLTVDSLIASVEAGQN